ncbi:Cyclic di-GMP phosphodiesterase response regulator RpfG [Achromobacter insolitus]|uniref:Cyclic di-GMP phosphodiesterase n=2 Tax=Alcaligenaceae TaxID=506 RepID=A0A6S7EWM7_9BURK|nr:Cyclic di-GMP phosphodiesterase [Achromobacter insolitus]CAB3929792.1 Cyclic di-GMP phosphodiesterase [Achromobacter insolitus]CAB3935210.1 Cyclic di-GMP phosphodiesterase [Achromobacter insolitus]VEG68172.1 Cyclic di-GMP phosphodiesterase response regulator RpfG [Achromobacter insolitus]
MAALRAIPMPPDVPEYPAGSCVAALSAAMRARDPATGRHSERVVALSVALAQACGLPQAEQEAVAVAARLHDIGKIGTPDRVLYSPKRLDKDDWEIMKAHAAVGADIIMHSDIPQRELIALAVRHHHEHFDGSGYPAGLCGADIPLHSRIISLADSYDALGDARPYHPARTHAEIMRILNQEAGSKCDPDLLRTFEAMIQKSRLRVP